MNIPQQLQFLNQPVVLGRVQDYSRAAAMLRQNQGSLIGLDPALSVWQRSIEMSKPAEYPARPSVTSFRTSFGTFQRTTQHAHRREVIGAILSIILSNSLSTFFAKSA